MTHLMVYIEPTNFLILELKSKPHSKRCAVDSPKRDKLTYPKTIEEESFESLSLANAGLEIANTHLQDENNELKAKLAKIEPMLLDLKRMLNGGK